MVIEADGTFAGVQDKVQIDPSEEATYTPGADRRIFRAGALTFGISICHEGFRYPETVRWAARRGAQVVFHPQFHEAEPGSFAQRSSAILPTRFTRIQRCAALQRTPATLRRSTTRAKARQRPRQ